ncbi:MAG: hypothetical protein ACREL7_14400, partial [Longimicrobiales bacterium]
NTVSGGLCPLTTAGSPETSSAITANALILDLPMPPQNLKFESILTQAVPLYSLPLIVLKR